MSLDAVVVRVRGEFLEMPGLSLTRAQAQRLWGLDDTTCKHVIASLVAHGFLRQVADGRICRSDA